MRALSLKVSGHEKYDYSTEFRIHPPLIIADPLFESPTVPRTQATTPPSLSLCLSFTFSHSDSRPRNTFCDLNFVSRDKLPDKSDFRPATKSHPRSKAWLCLDAWLPNSSSFFSSLFRFVPSSRPAIPWNPIGRLSKTVCASRGLSIHIISLYSRHSMMILDESIIYCTLC